MSSASLGGSRVGAVRNDLERLGYVCVRISASGQHRGQRRDAKRIAGDLLAFNATDEPRPHLVCEIGSFKKSLRGCFAEIHANYMPPGAVAIVVLFGAGNGRKRWYAEAEGGWHASLPAALAARDAR